MYNKSTLGEDQLPLLFDSNSRLSAMSGVNINDDPFYSVKDSVISQIERIKIRNDKFMDLLHNCDTR